MKCLIAICFVVTITMAALLKGCEGSTGGYNASTATKPISQMSEPRAMHSTKFGHNEQPCSAERQSFCHNGECVMILGVVRDEAIMSCRCHSGYEGVRCDQRHLLRSSDPKDGMPNPLVLSIAALTVSCMSFLVSCLVIFIRRRRSDSREDEIDFVLAREKWKQVQHVI